MEQHWLIIERVENWEADRKNGFSFFGLPPRYKSISSKIRKGDKVYCYVSSGISAFSDIRLVRDAGIKKMKEDSFHDIYSRNFAYYFTTEPVLILAREKWVPLTQLVSALELTRERTFSSRRAVFQTSIRMLSPADAKLLNETMERVGNAGPAAPTKDTATLLSEPDRHDSET
jgi:hypothetical protein